MMEVSLERERPTLLPSDGERTRQIVSALRRMADGIAAGDVEADALAMVVTRAGRTQTYHLGHPSWEYLSDALKDATDAIWEKPLGQEV